MKIFKHFSHPNLKFGTAVGLTICAAILMFSFNNCFGNFEVLKSVDTTSSFDERLAGTKLYTSNCAICHGPVETSTKRNKTASDITGAIYSQPQMAGLKFLSADDIRLIAIALSPQTEVPPGDGEGKTVTSPEVRIANRYMIRSNLQQVFVSDDLPIDASDKAILASIDADVTTQAGAFGGNCSRYDLNCIPKPCGAQGSDACLDDLAQKMAAAPVPTVNVMAKGYMVRVCEEILSVDKSVTTALIKSSLMTKDQPNPLPTAANVQTFMSFLFQDRPLTADAISKTVDVATQAGLKGMPTNDQWRFVMLSLCESNWHDLL